MDSWSKWQPDFTVIRGLADGFQDVLAIELKNPNGTGRLIEKQQVCHKHLQEEYSIDTVLGCIYEGRIIEIYDDYIRVFAKSQTPAMQDTRNTYVFLQQMKIPQYWRKKFGTKPALLDECEKRHTLAREV